MSLKLYDRGNRVRQLQLLLNAEPSTRPRLKPDGIFGQKTADAVRLFQKKHGLSVDGIAGPATWRALGQFPEAVKVVNTDSVEVPWLQVAVSELGVHEYSLPGKHNQRIIQYHHTTTLKKTWIAGANRDETAWCSSFVNWVMNQCGHEGTNNALAKSWLDWGTALREPRKGAITVIKKKGQSSDQATGSTTGYHVGFLIRQTPNYVRLLGGNQGDRVKYSNFYFSKWAVHGYRWPELNFGDFNRFTEYLA